MQRYYVSVVCTLVALVIMACAPAWGGAVDCFLRLDGVQGESADARHKDEIEVVSWSISDPPQLKGNPLNSGKRRLELAVTKHIDRASPRLFQAFGTGEHMREARLSFKKAGGGATDFLKYRLLELQVISYSIGGTGALPLETVVFSFAKSEMEYRPEGRDGLPGQPVISRFE